MAAAGSSNLTVTDTALNLDGHQFSGSQRASSFVLSGTSHADKEMMMDQASEHSEQLPQLFDTPEPEISTENVKCNLRKSLAWDSAFFTSAGVLDAEELSTIIEGGDKGVKYVLPGIQEDVHASMDSISTLETDNLTLESLEAELFEDIKASIQKCSRASKLSTLSNNAMLGGTDSHAKASSASKKVDLAAGNRVYSITWTGAPTAKSSGKMQKTAMTGSEKTIKQSGSSPQVTQPVTRTRESTSTIQRPTKAISKVNPTPSVAAKRASLSATHFEVENANSTCVVGLKGTQGSKPTSLGGPRRGLPKSSSSSTSRPSSTSSTTRKTESIRSTSSSGSSKSSSNNIGKSAVTSARINYSKVNSSNPILRTPSKAAVRSKLSTPTSGLSTHMISSKLSSNISPASSISKWSVSSSSSSSTATLNQKSTSRASLDASSSCRSSNVDLDLNLHFAEKTSDRNRNKKAELSSQNLKKAAIQTSSPSQPDSMKPSGLRMPSPKIGFFDGSKSVRTPNGGQFQARLSIGCPKLGAGLSIPNGGSNKAKPGKIPPKKVLRALKSDNRGSASPIRSILSKELPSPSEKATSGSKYAKSCLVKSSKDQSENRFSDVQVGPTTDSGKLNCSNSSALELSSEKNLIEVQKEEPAANLRTPLTEKNSLHSREGFDILTGSGIANLLSTEIDQKENI